MSAGHATKQHSRIVTVVSELEATISQRYPQASFEVFEGEEPKGTYLRATVDIEDPDLVTDLVVDRLLNVQVEQGLPLYFIAARPAEQAVQDARTHHSHRPYVASVPPPSPTEAPAPGRPTGSAGAARR